MVNCNGNCRQGRDKCQSPACCSEEKPPSISKVMVALLVMWCVGMALFAIISMRWF